MIGLYDKLADKKESEEKALRRVSDSKEFSGDRMYLIGRINTLIEVQQMIRGE